MNWPCRRIPPSPLSMTEAVRRLSAVLALALLLSGCEAAPAPETPAPTPSPTPTATLTPQPVQAAPPFTLPYYPGASLHPIAGDNQTNLVLLPLIYEPLFTLDQSFAASPALCAVSSISEDGLTWTLSVSPGHTFSDGTPVTPGDVAASLIQALRPGSRFEARLAGIRSVREQDGLVQLQLTAPNGALDALLDVPVFREAEGAVLGSGPYALQQKGEDLFLAKNPFWTGRLPFDEVILAAVTETDTLIQGFDRQDISLVSTDPTGSSSLNFSGAFDVWEYPTSVMLYLGFNAKAGLCRDAALRQAFSRCIDRDAVAASLLSRHAVAADLPVSPYSALYSPEAAALTSYDLQAAQTLLEEAGCTLNEGVLYWRRSPVSLRLIVNSDNSFKNAVADYVAECLNKTGAQVTVEVLPWDGYSAALAAGNFDLYLGEVRMTADFDLSPFLERNGALNFGGYSNEDTSALLSAYRAARGPERTAAASLFYQQLSTEAPLTALCFKTCHMLTHWGMLEGAAPTQQNVFDRLEEWTYAPSGQKQEE